MEQNNKLIASYETNSYLNINEEIKLNINKKPIKWESLNEEIAVVNDGIVLGKSKGNATIRVYYEDSYFDFDITVLSNKENEIIKDLVKSHNSNILLKRDYNVGKVYETNIVESVNKFLFEPLIINNEFNELANKKWENNTSKEIMKSIEFITVHYTANFRDGANARAHGNYFAMDNHDTSIHYNTGNDGVYHCLDDHKRGAHAGDSRGPEFSWIDTGIEYDNIPLEEVKVTVSNDFYYVINGKKSLIKLPETYDYNDRNTKHSFLDNGMILNNSNNEQKHPEKYFNDMGFKFNIINNKYHMSTTWWCYTQTLDGRICNVGGNRNSIGIESCVNKGSDLWYTWQITAKLVAKLLVDNKLDVYRVVGHHFFTAKHCPAQLLENNLELWNEFIELVKVEYLLLTKYNNYNIKLLPLTDNINVNGRINSIEETKLSYKVIIKDLNNFIIEEIILNSIISQ